MHCCRDHDFTATIRPSKGLGLWGRQRPRVGRRDRDRTPTHTIVWPIGGARSFWLRSGSPDDGLLRSLDVGEGDLDQRALLAPALDREFGLVGLDQRLGQRQAETSASL